MGAEDLSVPGLPSIAVGGEMVFAPFMAGGKSYWFNSIQVQFLLAHQRLKNVDAAALAVGRGTEWARQFLASKKWKAFRDAKLELARNQNGISLERLMQFNEWTLSGKRTWYEALCAFCGLAEEWSVTEAEMCRTDDLKFEAACKACFKPAVLTYKEEPFKPSREQVEVWKEDLARMWPKVERVHHQFEKAEFVFESAEGDPS